MTGNAVLSVISFICISIFSHHLSISDYALIREVYLYSGLLALMGSAGFAQALYYYGNKNKLSLSTYIGQSRILLTTLLIICIAIYSIVWFWFLKFSFSELYIYILLYALTLGFSSVDLNISLIINKSKAFFTGNIIINLLKVGSFYYGSKIGFGVTDFLWLSFLFQGSTIIYNSLIFKQYYLGNIFKAIRLKYLKQISDYASPLLMGSLIGYLVLNTNKFICLFLNNNDEEFAILNNVAFEIPLLGNIYAAFSTIAIPLMIKNLQQNNMTALLNNRKSYIKTVTKIVFPIVIALILWHSDFIILAFGQQYADYSYLFAIYTIISFIRICSHQDIMLITNNTSMIMKIQIAELFVHFTIAVLMYSYFQFPGLIYASLISNYLYVVFINLINAKLLNVKTTELFPFRFIFIKLLTHFIIILLIKFMTAFIFPHILWYIVCPLSITVIYIYEYFNNTVSEEN